jgi:hypothetical protein
MAVGDVVSTIGALNTVVTFQPAVGVECMLSSMFVNGGTNTYFQLNNGTNRAEFSEIALTNINHANVKIFINNTNFIYLRNIAASYQAFTGITTK